MIDILTQTISNCPLFTHMDDAAKASVVQVSSVKRYVNEQLIVAEGHPLISLFIVASGSVHVSTNTMGKIVDLKTLMPGKYFGEVSLMSGKNATATVVAIGEVELVEIPKASIGELVKNDAILRKILEGITLDRAKDTLGKVLK